MIDFKVSDSGYNNYREVHGWIYIDIGLDENVSIDVIEMSRSGGRGHEVRMFLNFKNDELDFIKKVRQVIPTFVSLDGGDTFEISDEKLINKLFIEYGNNGTE